MNIPDFVELEMRMAQLMADQQRTGFRFDLDGARFTKDELSKEVDQLREEFSKKYPFVPGKVFTPRRHNKKEGYIAGCPMTRLEPFNPTSRQNIAWVLTHRHGIHFTKVTDTGKPKVDEASLSELKDIALQEGNEEAAKDCENFIRILTLQKWMGQLSEGTNSWLNTIEDDGCIHHSCSLATQTGRNAHRGPNLGQVVSAPWSRRLFLPHVGHVLMGCDLEGLELRCLGHYLAPFDGGAFADVVVNGDVHQQNADRVGCSRREVKTLTYAFIYGAGDTKLGHSLHPEYSEPAKKALGTELRRKFLDAIPGLEPLVAAVKDKVRLFSRLKALDGRPIHISTEHAGLNYLLQSAGAILSKRWCVISTEMIEDAGLVYGRDYTRCAYVHDEQQLSCLPSVADQVAELVVRSAPLAGQYYKFRVPITASSECGMSWADTH
jgi:DNA polymerase I-like protein with 3'-5' exonuclease and polymerase domains